MRPSYCSTAWTAALGAIATPPRRGLFLAIPLVVTAIGEDSLSRRA